jgi:SNF2 family DNA or RNA helicase
MRKAFPKLRVLEHTDKTVERDWNAGGIPLLAAHPKSAGHGLNLQHGGNILVYFGQDWNLEDFDQILERIGPTRQRQSGYKRAVFVYHILARGTLDAAVKARRATKVAVVDALMDAMKGR